MKRKVYKVPRYIKNPPGDAVEFLRRAEEKIKARQCSKDSEKVVKM